MKTKNRKQAFTIVETLIAVAVLMIAIAGPLVVATKGLTAALASKNQMIASYLAQETMELIKNRRDNNLSSVVTGGWLDGFTISSTCYDSTHTCELGGLNPGILDCSSMPNDRCVLYYNPASGYINVQTSGATQTIFTRSFYLESRPANNGKQERLAHVMVDWNEGSVPYQVRITSQLVEAIR